MKFKNAKQRNPRMLSGSSRKPLRCAVFISGSGSTLQSLLEMQHQFDINLVISNKSAALGLKKAKRFGKTCLLIKNPINYELLHQRLIEFRIERIFLAGFMKLLPVEFVQKWQGRMMNIHPSLLPLYPGLDSAMKSWQDQSDMGASIHQVNDQMDQGQVFLQKCSQKAPFKHELGFGQSEIYLRRTEQHLLREMALRWK